MNRTKIDWVQYSWNPVWGCTHGCPYCYAKKIARRFGKRVCGRSDFKPTFISRNYRRPMPTFPSTILVNSMSDVADWKDEWFGTVFDRIQIFGQHLFFFLTKRPTVYKRFNFPANCWLGVSWTGVGKGPRWPENMGSNERFLSLEPLHAAPDPDSPAFLDVAWVIIGAETGNRRGKVLPQGEWIRSILWLCKDRGIPVFMKASLRPFVTSLIRGFPND